MLHALAFIIWDVGSRAPGQLAADVYAGLRSWRTFGRGLWRFVLGLMLLASAALLLLTLTILDIRTEFFTLETGAIVTGLLVEMLVGAQVRRVLRPR